MHIYDAHHLPGEDRTLTCQLDNGLEVVQLYLSYRLGAEDPVARNYRSMKKPSKGVVKVRCKSEPWFDFIESEGRLVRASH